MSTHAHSHEQLAERKGPKSGPANEATRQRRYGRKLRGRFAKIRAEIRRSFSDAAPPEEQLAPGDEFSPDDLTPGQFDFGDTSQSHDEFMAWLNRQQRNGVLSVISRDDNVYVRRALSDGDRWAIARLREKGYAIEGTAATPEDFLSVSRSASIAGSFNAPVPANKVRLLFQRNYGLLEGITSDVSNQIGRVLSEGLTQGLNPNDIAEEMAERIDTVGSHRATLMARHEIMYAHNVASEERYRQAGVGRVKVLGSDPCPQCQPYVGKVYPLNDLPEGGPPFHPQCVGVLTPVML